MMRRTRGAVRIWLGRRMRQAGRLMSALLPGYFIRIDFPPSARSLPRYGYGRPPHARMHALLAAHDPDYRTVLEGFTRYADALRAIPPRDSGLIEPHWGNGALYGLDGVSLYCFTRERTPRRYVEIGSGNSTQFVDRARRDGGIDMKITSIDPSPRREIDSICDAVLRERLECTDLGVFSDLQEGDIVFLDGTHRVFMNSDVAVFFLDVLPELPAGVLVGIHDVHLPDDYRPEHAGRLYSEQYLLASYLLAEASWIRPLLPCWHVSGQPELGGLVRSLMQPGAGGRGVIFWLQTRPRS